MQSWIWKPRAHRKRDACSAACIPQEVQAQQSEGKQIAQRRIPTLMFHYAFLVVWEPLLGWPLLQNDAFRSQTDAHSEANPKMMHFVHKMFAD
jgi:hypothetical protein